MGTELGPLYQCRWPHRHSLAFRPPQAQWREPWRTEVAWEKLEALVRQTSRAPAPGWVALVGCCLWIVADGSYGSKAVAGPLVAV